MQNTQEVRSVKKWVLLLIMPIVALAVVALAQMIASFVLAGSTSAPETGLEAQDSASVIKATMNVISIVVGVVSVIALFLTPLWLVMLVRDLKGHVRSKNVAIVLAVLFGLFSWIYTFEKNNKKFWINLGLSVVTLGYWSPVAWLWAIIDNASKPGEFYTGYNDSQPVNSTFPTN